MTQTAELMYVSETLAIEAYKNRKKAEAHLTFMEFLQLKNWQIRTK